MRYFLEHLLGSRTRAKILRLVLSHPDQSYFVREISRKIGEHVNSVRRELAFLTDAGIVKVSGEGQKRFYAADADNHLYHELRSLVFKAQVLEERQAIKLLDDGKIILAVLSGFFVNRDDAPTDVLIVGTVNREKLKRTMSALQNHFDRPVRFTAMTKQEYDQRQSMTDRFLYDILGSPVLTVIDRRPVA